MCKLRNGVLKFYPKVFKLSFQVYGEAQSFSLKLAETIWGG